MKTKDQVKYRKGSPIRNCGLCTMYRGSRCTAVSGPISPFGYCEIFKSETSPFTSTLTADEKRAIEEMAAR